MDFLELNKMVETGKSKNVKAIVAEALENGVSPKDILEQGLLPGMSVIGDKFKNNEVYVPEVLIAARAMNAGVTILKPYLATADVKAPGTAVIGTVKGDLHDIGKNLVRGSTWLTWGLTFPLSSSLRQYRNTMRRSSAAPLC